VHEQVLVSSQQLWQQSCDENAIAGDKSKMRKLTSRTCPSRPSSTSRALAVSASLTPMSLAHALARGPSASDACAAGIFADSWL